MFAEKGNRVYQIGETNKKHYRDMGFDIKDNDGKVIEPGKGKSVSLEQYQEIAEALEKARAHCADLERQMGDKNKELERLSAEVNERDKEIEQLISSMEEQKTSRKKKEGADEEDKK